MRLVLFFAMAIGMDAAVVLTEHESRTDVVIDGKPFTSFFYGPDAPKPYLHPLRTASGAIVTRVFPMEPTPGETKDRHHRGMWFGYRDINGCNFWENEFSYNDPNAGRVVTRSVTSSGAIIKGVFAWLSPKGETLLEETRNMTFEGSGNMRAIAVDVTFRALADVTFGDTKDGFFAIRLAAALSEAQGGVITNSNGDRTMKQAWGQAADSVDYSGEIKGERVAVTVTAEKADANFPPRWHVRDYGLLAANPFGAHAFDPALAASHITLKPGQSLHLRYRVTINSGR